MFPHTFWGQVNFPSSQAEDLGSVNPSQGLGNLCLVHLASPLHPWDGGEEQWLPQPSPQKDYKGLRGEMETINEQGLAACLWKGRTSLLECVIQSNPMHSGNIAFPCTCAAHSNTFLLGAWSWRWQSKELGFPEKEY